MISITAIVISLLICSGSAIECDIQGYYWRDFSGHIPSDAIPGGIDSRNQPMFIGQAPVTNEYLSPGRIDLGSSKMYSFWSNKVHSTDRDIKILCTQHLNYFEWIPSNSTMATRIRDHVVVGGYYQSVPVFVGRARRGRELVVGWLAIHDNPKNTALYIVQGSETARLTSFEVLVYNPRITK